MPMEPLVTVARFTSHPEARVAADYLQAYGVMAHVLEQDRLRFDPLRPGHLPGVRVQVRSDQEAEARALLEAAGSAEEETP